MDDAYSVLLVFRLCSPNDKLGITLLCGNPGLTRPHLAPGPLLLCIMTCIVEKV